MTSEIISLTTMISASVQLLLRSGVLTICASSRHTMTGNTLLRVVEGVATVELVGYLVKELVPGEMLVLAATSVLDWGAGASA